MNKKFPKTLRENLAAGASIKNPRICRNLSLLQFNSACPNLIESPKHNYIPKHTISISNEAFNKTMKAGMTTRNNSMASFSLKYNDNLRSSPSIIIQEKVRAIEKLPLTSEKALKTFAKNLNSYETVEILTFRDIFYVNPSKKPETSFFDDQAKNLVVFENDHIAYRYQIKKILGVGSFSQVYEAYDWKKRKNVAIKIIRNKDKYKKQSVKEIEFLKFIKDKNNNLPFAEMLTSFEFREHICIVFKIIGPSIERQVFEVPDLLKYLVDILVCLKFLHSHKIIHCDVKPSNILLNSNKVAHLVDLGTATYVNEQVYKYVQSRNYRAPEVVLRVKYTEKVDMWSLGCVLYEAVKGKMLFDAKDEAELLANMCRKIGPPPKVWKKNCEKVWGTNTPVDANELEEDLRDMHPALKEIVSRCVQWDPKSRISSSEAFNILKNMISYKEFYMNMLILECLIAMLKKLNNLS